MAVLVLVVAVGSGTVGAQEEDDNELDRFMALVLEQRERNAAARLQYVLDEESRFHLAGPGGAPLWGFRGEYTWYARDGVFVRSPVRIDGVAIDEARRREYETDWLQREQRRDERRRNERRSPTRASRRSTHDNETAAGGRESGAGAPEPAWDGIEPRFLSDAYFLDFEFEPGNYYLVGRETLDGHDVLRIEYYPERMFAEEDSDDVGGDPDRDDGDPDVPQRQVRVGAAPEAAAMDKTSLVTLWVDPAQHQIVRYTFDNLGFDFLPGRWLFRLDDLTASMTMRQPFPGVWLPSRIDMRAALSLATGTYEATATRTYTGYREAETGGRLRAVGPDLPR